jgi:rhamnose transport system permease protein
MLSDKRMLALAGSLVVLLTLPLLGVEGFYTWDNLRNLALDNLPVLIAAIGMTFVIIAGQIDISIGSVFAVCGAIAGLLAKTGTPMVWVVLGTICCGAVSGAVNGGLVTWLKIPAIIATLATMVICRSVIIRATGGDWIQNLPEAFQWFGIQQSTAQLLYLLAGMMIFSVALFCLRQTTFGRSFYAVGCDREAARRIGFSPAVVSGGVFVLMGLFTALAALLNFTRYPTIETSAGAGFELKVIAAVVVGGTAITGGRGSLVGTLLGVALLGSIGTVFTFLHLNPAWERAIQGAIILAAVVSDSAFRTRSAK